MITKIIAAYDMTIFWNFEIRQNQNVLNISFWVNS